MRCRRSSSPDKTSSVLSQAKPSRTTDFLPLFRVDSYASKKQAEGVIKDGRA